jgi:hypothetical protein
MKNKIISLSPKHLLENVCQNKNMKFLSVLYTFIGEARLCSSNEQLILVQKQFISILSEIDSIRTVLYNDVLYIDTIKKRFFGILFFKKRIRISCRKNKFDKLFLVVDHRQKKEYYYCYQPLSSGITITSFG